MSHKFVSLLVEGDFDPAQHGTGRAPERVSLYTSRSRIVKSLGLSMNHISLHRGYSVSFKWSTNPMNRLSLTSYTRPKEIDSLAICRPGMCDSMTTEEMLRFFSRLHGLDHALVRQALVKPSHLTHLFMKIIPQISRYLEYIYFLFDPAWVREGPNTTEKLSFFQELLNKLMPIDAIDPEHLPDDAEEVQREQTLMERQVRLIKFCRYIKKLIIRWTGNGNDPTTNNSLKAV